MTGRWFLIGWLAMVMGCGTAVDVQAPEVSTPPIRDGFEFPGGLGNPKTDAQFGELVRAIESDRLLKGGIGVSIAVVVDGELRHTAGLGRRSSSLLAAPIDDHTLFAIGTTTELVTAVTMMKLVEEGRLSLDGSLGPLLNGVDVQPRGVSNALTVHQLLTHTSGLGYPDGASRLPIDWSTPSSLSALYGRATFPTWSRPGAVFNRHWIGAGLAGHLAEVVTGEYFTDVAEGRVLNPVGMFDATYEPIEAQARHFAVGASGGPDENVEVDPGHPGFVALPTTGLFASVTDLGRLAAALVGPDGPLDETTKRVMTTPHVDTQNAFYRAQGYGMMVWDDDGYRLTAAADSSGGYGSLIMTAPEHGFAVVLQSNADWYGLSYGAYRAFEIFLGKRIALFSGEETSSSEQATFSGTYVDPHRLGRVNVGNTARGLTAQFESFDHEAVLTQVAANVFWFAMSPSMTAQFGNNGAAVVTFFDDPTDGRRYFVTNVGVGVRD